MAYYFIDGTLIVPTIGGQINLTLNKYGAVRIERISYGRREYPFPPEPPKSTTIVVPLDAFKELEKAEVLS